MLLSLFTLPHFACDLHLRDILVLIFHFIHHIIAFCRSVIYSCIPSFILLVHSLTTLAFCIGYSATVVSHNVPPYGRAGLYKELAAIKDFINDLRTAYFSSPLSAPLSPPSSSSMPPSSLPLPSGADLTPFKDLIPLITAAAEKSGKSSTLTLLSWLQNTKDTI
jgi:hypothetical protein